MMILITSFDGDFEHEFSASSSTDFYKTVQEAVSLYRSQYSAQMFNVNTRVVERLNRIITTNNINEEEYLSLREEIKSEEMNNLNINIDKYLKLDINIGDGTYVTSPEGAVSCSVNEREAEKMWLDLTERKETALNILDSFF